MRGGLSIDPETGTGGGGGFMKLELRRVAPLRAANIGAMVYGLLMCAFALIFAPFIFASIILWACGLK